MTPSKSIALVGAGMAGIACARTLAQAGHRVTVFEQTGSAGGRMATRRTEFGGFDPGAQYFTVRDPRFARALDTVPGLYRPWSVSTIRLLDEQGRMAAAGVPVRETHWIPVPGMSALPERWLQPLVERRQVEFDTRVTRLARDALAPGRWQLHTEGLEGARHVFSGFDAVLLAIPAARAQALLADSRLADPFVQKIGAVRVAPCWALMLAFPQAMQPDLITLGPQWNAARSTHHRIAWLARESSKPRREAIERWTVHASTDWSREHLEDDAARVQGKLIKAFAEITGIRAEPAHASMQRWRDAQTLRPLGVSHLWDAKTGIGVCGDWCIGDRVEDAFLSGLELALTVA